MDSFVAHNTYPISRYILIEDSGDRDMLDFIEQRFGDLFDTVLFNEPRLGQIRSVDRAYAEIDTPYLFHCEDDFEFFRGGFMEESLSVLRHDPQAITVWMRHLWDCKKHKLGERIRYTPDNVMYREVLPKVSHKETWYGFTFNPGLRRRVDYERIKPFAAVGHELQINYRYHELGFHGVVLEEGATRHIGAGHHVSDVSESWYQRVRAELRRRRRARRERRAHR
ncbi:glycosyl transferase [Salinisphaera shabanensis]|uniref:glycosyl transferase n=1 Tax=Salinisphaera shabanensis TaxID=180542 RepID=UPI00334079C2